MTPSPPIPTFLFVPEADTPPLPARLHPPLQEPQSRRVLLALAEAALVPLPDSPRAAGRHNPDLDAGIALSHAGYYDSDDAMTTYVDAPKFVRGHQTYGDAEFFCRKACRLLRSGRYSSYDM